MKILDFAIDVETAERDLYRRLADCSQDVGVRSVFRMIAADEGKLLKKLRQLKADPKNRSVELHAPLKEHSSIQKAQSASCELISQNSIHDDLGSYSYIMRTEQLLLNLYLNLLEHESDPEAKALFNLILQEKQAEIDRVHMLYDFLSAPDKYLAWGELTDLDHGQG